MKGKLFMLMLAASSMVVTSLGGMEVLADDSGDTVTIMGEEVKKEDITGSITVLLDDTENEDLFEEYAEQFKELYPNVDSVEFECISDYDNNCKIRLNAGEYPDVLYNPNIASNEYSQYFLSLGSTDALKEEYLFAERGSYDGNVYTIPASGDVSGIEYNKKVFEQAGITELPTSRDEFIEDLQKIKDNTDAIPWYSNYNAGWPLNQLKGNEAVIADDPSYRNCVLPFDDAPFSEGKPNYELYKFLYEVTEKGLIEDDPVTSDYDMGLQMVADGRAACVGLGSWALDGIRALAENPDDVGFMAWPSETKKAMLNAGYALSVNKNTESVNAAKAFVQWFIKDSGYAQYKGRVSGEKGGEMPDNLNDLKENGVEFMTESPAKQGYEGLTEEICNESEVGLYTEKFGRRIIDTALGKSQEGFTSYDDICNSMNEAWKAAKDKVFAERNITE